ncbi:MAG: hypothetical protein J6K82_04195 [Alphaproteobacteria bacterium]|nr:hypothetical protein [Alphaproteobacteria bacterium]
MDKKLFPGVSEYEIRIAQERQAQEQIAQTAREVYISDRKKRNAANEDAESYRRLFYPMFLINADFAKEWFTKALLGNIIVFVLGSAGWGVGRAVATRNDDVKNAYITRIDWESAAKNAYFGTDINKYGRRAAAHTMAQIVSFLAVLVVAKFKAARTRKQHLAYARDVHDAMINSLDGVSTLPPVLRMHLDWISSSIVENISAEDSRYFNKLIDGRYPDATKEFATAIVTGHLSSHPESIKVLTQIFELESLPAEWRILNKEKTR